MADDDIDLNNALRGVEPEEPEEPAQPEPEETEVTAEQPEQSDNGEQAEKPDESDADDGDAEKQEATAASEKSDQENWTIAAVKDERRKRQELERRIAEYEQKAQKQDEPDFWDDPDGKFRREREHWKSELDNHKLNMSEQMARQQFDDMDERLEEFKTMVDSDPSMYQKVMQNPHPWLAMAQEVQKSRDRKGFDDADEYLKAKEADIEKRIQEGIDKGLSERKEKRDEKGRYLPKSAADIPQSAGNKRAQQEAASAEPSLDEALRG